MVTEFAAPRLVGDRPKPGARIDGVEARGKNLLVHFDDGLTLRTHMRMTGAWHLYRAGERWQKGAHLARATIAVDTGWVAVCFAAPVVETYHRALAEPVPLAGLGPDLCQADADVDHVLERLAALCTDTTQVADALLDQRVAAGIGNIYKSETLWACAVDPFAPVLALGRDAQRHLFTTASRLLRANLGDGPRATHAGGFAVYGRRGQPCRRCGTPVRCPTPRRAGADHVLVSAVPSAPRSALMVETPRVVIVGAGFAGIEVARGLDGCRAEVVLVDRNNFRTFQPLLYQVATAGLNAADVAHAVRGLLHRQSNADFRMGEVTGVDWERRVLADRRPGAAAVRSPRAGDRRSRVVLRRREVRPSTRYRSTRCTTPCGCGTTSSAGSRPQRRRRHSSTTARSPSSSWAAARPASRPRARSPSCSRVSSARTTGPSTSRERASILLELQDRLLPPFAPSSGRHATEALAGMHVEVRTGEQVESVTATSVTLASGEVIPAHTLVWAAGVRASPLADVLGLEQGPGGRVVVASDLSVPGHPGVWVVGDLAHAVDRGAVLPQLAPVAMQGGRHVARQIRRVLEGTATRPFRYRNKGTMATIGRRAAVAELPGGLRLKGTLGWLAWLGLHLALPRRQAQPRVGAVELGVDVPHLGPRSAAHPAHR